MAYSCFVVRPFGQRTFVSTTGESKTVDFARVHAELIAPAIAAAGLVGNTTEDIAEAGNIREDMFQLLAHADLVIADISLHNANVFYELGARHALRKRRTFLIRFASKVSAGPAAKCQARIGRRRVGCGGRRRGRDDRVGRRVRGGATDAERDRDQREEDDDRGGHAQRPA